MRRDWLVFLSMIGLVLSGCGPSSTSGTGVGDGVFAQGETESSLGQCQGEDTSLVALMTADRAISRIDALLQVPSDDLRSQAEVYAGQPEAEPGFDFSGVLASSDVLGGRAPFEFDRLFVALLDIPDMLSLPEGGDALVGVVDLGDGSGLAGMFGLIGDGGDVVFFGDCARAVYQESINEYAARGAGNTDVSLVTLLVVDDAELASFASWLASPTPNVAWEDRPPQSRILDPEETPAEHLATLDAILLAVAVPPEWTKLNGAICTYAVDEGWNECQLLTPLGDQGLTSFELLGWVGRDAAIEVWLVPAFDLANPVARLTQIESATMPAAEGPLTATVEIGATGQVTLAEIAAIVERGDLVVVVTAGTDS